MLVVPHRLRPIGAGAVLALYRAEGWWPERSADQVAAVLSGSPAVGAWAGDDLVGFARAVTDGTLRAYVEDVIVAPPWRGHGVGYRLVETLLDQLRPIPVVTLFCGPDLVDFYAPSGFAPTRQVVLHRSST